MMRFSRTKMDLRIKFKEINDNDDDDDDIDDDIDDGSD